VEGDDCWKTDLTDYPHMITHEYTLNGHMPSSPRIMETLTRMDTHVFYVCLPLVVLSFPSTSIFFKLQTCLRTPPHMYHAYLWMHMRRCRTQARGDIDESPTRT